MSYKSSATVRENLEASHWKSPKEEKWVHGGGISSDALQRYLLGRHHSVHFSEATIPKKDWGRGGGPTANHVLHASPTTTLNYQWTKTLRDCFGCIKQNIIGEIAIVRCLYLKLLQLPLE